MPVNEQMLALDTQPLNNSKSKIRPIRRWLMSMGLAASIIAGCAPVNRSLTAAGNLLVDSSINKNSKNINHISFSFDPFYQRGSLLSVICLGSMGEIRIISKEVSPNPDF